MATKTNVKQYESEAERLEAEANDAAQTVTDANPALRAARLRWAATVARLKADREADLAATPINPKELVAALREYAKENQVDDPDFRRAEAQRAKEASERLRAILEEQRAAERQR